MYWIRSFWPLLINFVLPLGKNSESRTLRLFPTGYVTTLASGLFDGDRLQSSH